MNDLLSGKIERQGLPSCVQLCINTAELFHNILSTSGIQVNFEIGFRSERFYAEPYFQKMLVLLWLAPDDCG
jgi:hypothetical protein